MIHGFTWPEARISAPSRSNLPRYAAKRCSMRAKCELAEARADEAEKRAASVEAASHLAADQALQAERLSTKLHDKVVTVFGIGSRAHAVLEAVATSATE